MNLSELAQITFDSQLEIMQLNLEGCIDGKDPIHLHDFRVSNRRIRTALGDFKELLPISTFAEYRKKFRWIHKITGKTRELDVTLAHIPFHIKKMAKSWRPYLHPAITLLEDKRQRAQDVLADRLGSQKTLEILESFSLLLVEVLDHSQLSQESPREYGSRLIVERYRKLRYSGREITKKTQLSEYHDFRIEIKRLRFLIDSFQPVLDRDQTKRLRIDLKGVQDALGSYHDTELERERIEKLAIELHNSGIELKTLLAIGQLIGRYEKSGKRFQKDSLKEIRWLISDSTARRFQSCFQYPVD